MRHKTCLVQHNCLIEEKEGSGGSGNSVMKEERNEPMVWDELFWGAEEIAAECGMGPPSRVIAQISLIVLVGSRITAPGAVKLLAPYESIIESACKVLVQIFVAHICFVR